MGGAAAEARAPRTRAGRAGGSLRQRGIDARNIAMFRFSQYMLATPS